MTLVDLWCAVLKLHGMLFKCTWWCNWDPGLKWQVLPTIVNTLQLQLVICVSQLLGGKHILNYVLPVLQPESLGGCCFQVLYCVCLPCGFVNFSFVVYIYQVHGCCLQLEKPLFVWLLLLLADCTPTVTNIICLHWNKITIRHWLHDIGSELLFGGRQVPDTLTYQSLCNIV